MRRVLMASLVVLLALCACETTTPSPQSSDTPAVLEELSVGGEIQMRGQYQSAD